MATWQNRPPRPSPPDGVRLGSSVPGEALASALETVAEAVIVTDPDGRVTYWNAAATGLYGFTSEEAVGQRLDALILGLGRQAAGGSPSGAAGPGVATGRRTATEWLTRDRDGRRFWVTVRTRPLAVGEAGTQHTLTVITGTARQKVAFEAAQWLASVVDSSSDAIVTLDRTGAVTWANAATATVFGWAVEDLIGRHISVLVPPGERDSQRGVVARVLTGTPVPAFVTTGLRRDGSSIEASVALSALRNDRREIVGVSAVIRDVTPHVELQREVGRQSALFAALSRRSSDVAIVTDAEGTISYVSPSVHEVFGYPSEAVIGLEAWAFVHRDDVPDVRSAVQRVLADPEETARVTFRIQNGRGEWRWVEETITNRFSEPEIGGLVANLRDVTEQVQAQEDIRRSEARYRAIAETAQEGIAVITPAGQLLFGNQKLADILGLPLEETYRARFITLFDESVARELARRLRKRAELGPETYELPYQHPDGSTRLLSISAAPLPLVETGEVGSLVMIADVTQDRETEQELRRRALHDALTDLPNRVLLADRLQMALARQDRAPVRSVALMFLDLDQFKMVNDSLGHDAGDVLLVEIGRRLQQGVRAGDTVARLGGDEFAILCEDIDERNAVLLAERLRARLVEAVDLGGHRVFVDASIGIALSPPHDAATLQRSADAAMYQAKSDGRGRTRVFNASLASSADRRLMVMSRLRESLGSGAGLDLHYQPIVDLATGAVQGVEALLRWTDERLGEVSPQEVVAAAEATGLTFALDRWVLGRGCADLARLRAEGVHPDVYLSVNVSALNIGATPLDELVPGVVDASGWPASQLVLEVTESAIMTDAASAAVLLERLRDLGVSIAVDDFGTGYSSLAYLKRLPVSVLKIDRSFTEHVTTDPDSLAIATAIVDLARGLGLRTIAEGIETQDQADAMRRLGCGSGQGYLWSRAMSLQDLRALGARPQAG
jgi:diguanylate cyclase (GGDEF)-like protein/PAS domain S-box-containing protein